MQTLEQLAAGDPETWNEAFSCLYPVAFEAARTRLGESFRGECEDMALETLSEILEKGALVNAEEELKPLAAAIARNKATDLLRRHLAEKRGGNKVQSLEAMMEANAGEPPGLSHDEFLDGLTVQELRRLLMDLSEEVKSEYRVVLRDHYFEELSYNEIAKKRKISVGSVGVYLQRGLASLRNVIARRPKLQSEFMAMVSDESVVRVLLPLVSVVHLGGWFYDNVIRYSLPSVAPSLAAPPDTDESRLRSAREEFPESQPLGEPQRELLLQKLKLKYPTQFQLWQPTWEERNRREREFNLRRRRAILRNQIIALLVVMAVLYGIMRFVRWLL
ncbi:MAG TPA: sigma-70 family RNA polymerase sigma factor [Candidatus Eisenbacteria bacterium]|jgi:RNA polymerase sigma factor (sigma-70 family)|nr:sigma-70 family RNA polymerase sigma factor [Candidatus Eisenbacteria bacterium]